jgi:hypothetical protein
VQQGLGLHGVGDKGSGAGVEGMGRG